MKEIVLLSNNIHNGNLILINKEHPISNNTNSYDKSLVSINFWREDILLDYVAAKELAKILTDLGCGNDIIPVDGYRSYETQNKIYKDSIKENGKQYTSQYVSLPTECEHRTGLAVDLAENTYYLGSKHPNFTGKGISMEFKKRASAYGFIQRYPKKKQKITGMPYAPWHFRYVGYPHSKIMEKFDFTMEEYISFLNTNSNEETPLEFSDYKHTYEIFTVKVNKQEPVIVQIPDNTPYQISGNNINGFVITLIKESSFNFVLKQQKALI